METDFSKLFPAVFDDKDILGSDWVGSFFDEFGGDAASNSACNTFVGFIRLGHEEHEIRVHFVVNRLTVEFTCGKPSKELVDKIFQFFSIAIDDDSSLISTSWLEDYKTIIFQYYHKPE